MNEKLKPCPFCGCEVEVVKVGRSWYRLQAAICHEDDCIFSEEWEYDISQNELALYFLTESWNKRFIETPFFDETEYNLDRYKKMFNVQSQRIRARDKEIKKLKKIVFYTKSLLQGYANYYKEVDYLESLTAVNLIREEWEEYVNGQ